MQVFSSDMSLQVVQALERAVCPSQHLSNIASSGRFSFGYFCRFAVFGEFLAADTSYMRP